MTRDQRLLAQSSLLYAPGHRRDLLRKAGMSQADGVICDLEDAVPATEKERARATVIEFLHECADAGAAPPDLFVRINVGDHGLVDLELLAGAPALAGILLPKSESARDVAAVAATLDRIEGPQSATILQPIIESAAGLFALAEQAAASSRVRRFSFGAADFVADLGATATPDRRETIFARSLIVARSRALGLVRPIAHVFGELANDDGLRRLCDEDRALGFGGRACIHPRQVAIVNEAFGGSSVAFDRARAIVAAYDDALKSGSGSLQMPDGTFVDEAIARTARQVIATSSIRSGSRMAREDAVAIAQDIDFPHQD